MNINLPITPSIIDQTYIAQLVAVLRTSLSPAITKDEATSRILLSSPDGTVYSITVSDTGTITATVNDGKSRL